MKTLVVQNLTKQYSQTRAVDNISFCAEAYEIIALLGPNGAGKSTLMNMIAGFTAPSSGTIEVMGSDTALSPQKCKEAIGFLPEGAPMYPDMSVKNFLQYMAELRGLKGVEKQKRLKEACDLAQIGNVLNYKTETLSKGYQRRVGFAQSILTDTPLLMLDEPTDGLDPNQKEHMRALIRKLGKNKTIIISTHLLEDAEEICSRIMIMNRGKIVADGSCRQILQQTRSRTLANAFRKLTAEE